ncbi:hypothetical protein V5O48_014893 [Marasmius crinis-equi]|uniref:Uncharacterized protein n=1 Tax=Marasmius crinis-equi TaxID=585013 RepID=A0ABR3EW09_9AGAR
MVKGNKTGRTSIDPYSCSQKVLTEQDVKLFYMQKEHHDVAVGSPFLHNVSPSKFLMFGLNLEDQQRRLMQDIKEHSYPTASQQTALLTEHTKIQQSITWFQSLQKVYTLAALITTSTVTPPSTAAKLIDLLLPSSLPPSVQKLPEMAAWIQKQVDFFRAQLKTSLHRVRTKLFVQDCLNLQQSLHVRG